MRLDGVDLSPGMLKRAEAAGTYDQLNESDLTEYIRGKKGAYDLIVAADVLCYIGDLQDVAGRIAEFVECVRDRLRQTCHTGRDGAAAGR